MKKVFTVWQFYWSPEQRLSPPMLISKVSSVSLPTKPQPRASPQTTAMAKSISAAATVPASLPPTTAKFAEKANLQLVATKQYEQKACPFSGGELNPETAVKVAGVSVAFCCNNCKGKAESAEDDAAKVKMVFANKAFEKGFKKKSADES